VTSYCNKNKSNFGQRYSPANLFHDSASCAKPLVLQNDSATSWSLYSFFRMLGAMLRMFSCFAHSFGNGNGTSI